MAEFNEVMRQWNRMCNIIDKTKYICSDGEKGYICPMRNNGLCNKSVSAQTDSDWKDGEKLIMSWAAEHPEPIYPTWAEWLSKQGLVKLNEGQFVRQTENEYIYECKTVAILTDKAAVPIPADTAQKLGIEPKEK